MIFKGVWGGLHSGGLFGLDERGWRHHFIFCLHTFIRKRRWI